MLRIGMQLGRDERGFIVSSELVLVASLCVIGLVTGLTCVRDAGNGELGDVAHAIGSLNQSYSYTGFHGCTRPKCGVTSWTRGSSFSDLQDERQAAELDVGEAPAVVAPPVVTPPVVAPAPIPMLPAPRVSAPLLCPPEAPVVSTPVYSSVISSSPLPASGCSCNAAPLPSPCECQTPLAAPVCPPPAPCGGPALGGPAFGGPRVLVW